MSEYGIISKKPFAIEGVDFYGMDAFEVQWHNGARFVRFCREGEHVDTPISILHKPFAQKAVDAIRNTFDFILENTKRG